MLDGSARRLCLYFRTVRDLKSVQVYGRFCFRLGSPKPDLSTPPPLRARAGDWSSAPSREQSLIGPHLYHLLAETGDIDEIGWEGPQRSRLWRYNQHYFDDLNAQGCDSRCDWHMDLLIRWVEENPPAKGVGWEPYPTSLRIVNWVKWTLAGNRLPARCVKSLAVQARWLAKRIEFHLLGNHLIANAKALIFAGMFFEGPEAAAWRRRGISIVVRQWSEQILDDGGHFERSPMYHALMLEDLLDLLNVANSYEGSECASDCKRVQEWRVYVPKMIRWLECMTHPDGNVSFFNDSAFGIAPSLKELREYASHLNFVLAGVPQEGIERLESSGYARISKFPLLALIDVAPIGPRYLPAHAHADTLSFELSIGQQRIFVNSGTSTYEAGSQREWQRSTAAHNTVVVDGEDSSEVWASFRVAGKAQPYDLDIDVTGQVIRLTCSHDGYRRLKGAPVHRREWRVGNGVFAVEDSVTDLSLPSESRFYCHPAVVPHISDDGRGGVLETPDGLKHHWSVAVGEARLEPATWYPRFGVKMPTTVIVVTLVDGASSLGLEVSCEAIKSS